MRGRGGGGVGGVYRYKGEEKKRVQGVLKSTG